MKSINCKDVGIVDCNWTAKAETESELMKMAAEHGKSEHGLQNFSDEQIQMIKSKIKDEKPLAA